MAAPISSSAPSIPSLTRAGRLTGSDADNSSREPLASLESRFIATPPLLRGPTPTSRADCDSLQEVGIRREQRPAQAGPLEATNIVAWPSPELERSPHFSAVRQAPGRDWRNGAGFMERRWHASSQSGSCRASTSDATCCSSRARAGSSPAVKRLPLGSLAASTPYRTHAAR
jgi:hypothetical protein